MGHATVRGFHFRRSGRAWLAAPAKTARGEAVDRRKFMKFGGLAAMELGAARLLMSQARPGMPGMQPAASPQENSQADFTLRIAPVTVELTPTRVISTIGYNGTSPGPVLRMKEGKPVT